MGDRVFLTEGGQHRHRRQSEGGPSAKALLMVALKFRTPMCDGLKCHIDRHFWRGIGIVDALQRVMRPADGV